MNSDLCHVITIELLNRKRRLVLLNTNVWAIIKVFMEILSETIHFGYILLTTFHLIWESGTLLVTQIMFVITIGKGKAKNNIYVWVMQKEANMHHRSMEIQLIIIHLR